MRIPMGQMRQRPNWITTILLSSSICCSLACAQPLVPVAPGDLVQLSRYTTVAPEPLDNEDDPLATIVSIQFPRREVRTVGDAIRYLLLRTGYAFSESEQQDPAVVGVLLRPLPESQRQLGTYKVEAMLKVLMGKSFVLHVDPLHRTISYAPNKTSDAGAAGRSTP